MFHLFKRAGKGKGGGGRGSCVKGQMSLHGARGAIGLQESINRSSIS